MGSGDDTGWDDACPFCTDSNNIEKKKTSWIACDTCDTWCHATCVGIKGEPDMVNVEFSEYHCPACEKDYGPSIPRRASMRKRAAVDYKALERGEPLNSTHVFNSRVDDYEYEVLPKMAIPSSNDNEEVGKNGISQPIVIRENDYEELGMRVPEGLTVGRIVDLVGGDRSLDVIDVETQNNLVGWDLNSWKDYFEDIKSHSKIRNVISLEVSDTPLGVAVKRPKLVEESDLISKVWPPDEQEDRPKVELYCLMSVAGAYTDFHIDFAGSSVFYHVCSGKKKFYLIPPSEQNLSKYEKWCNSAEKNEVFFADWVKYCYKVELDQGDSLIIPSGWIYAVQTPQDAIVIGGNFLTWFDISMQLRIVQIENKTHVPVKYRFPSFDKVVGYTIDYYSKFTGELSPKEVSGLNVLADYVVDPEMKEKLKSLDCVKQEKGEEKAINNNKSYNATTTTANNNNSKREITQVNSKPGSGEDKDDENNESKDDDESAKKKLKS